MGPSSRRASGATRRRRTPIAVVVDAEIEQRSLSMRMLSAGNTASRSACGVRRRRVALMPFDLDGPIRTTSAQGERVHKTCGAHCGSTRTLCEICWM